MKITGVASYQQQYNSYSSLAQRPSQTANKTSGSGNDAEEQKNQQEVQRLKAREAKVIAHESAHKSAGGAVTGAVTYQYTTGPDGKRYITGGEVSISIQGGSTPEQTISNMEQVIRAALAPADPSPQDRAVASQAAAVEQQAKQEQTAIKNEETKEKQAENAAKNEEAKAKKEESAAKSEETKTKQEGSAGKSETPKKINEESTTLQKGTPRAASPHQAAAYQSIPGSRTPAVSLFA